jgi:hypothetical protein
MSLTTSQINAVYENFKGREIDIEEFKVKFGVKGCENLTLVVVRFERYRAPDYVVKVLMSHMGVQNLKHVLKAGHDLDAFGLDEFEHAGPIDWGDMTADERAVEFDTDLEHIELFVIQHGMKFHDHDFQNCLTECKDGCKCQEPETKKHKSS